MRSKHYWTPTSFIK